ncbi:hypothetical protein D9756_000974 [Leucocoprinus leucothites]|uniref:Uncharacterized protein n=1 Tax=Leucocoprinus leucothites TaxID=201217 RepID=A0A8H5GEL4_9AGAR|nr:hypothetical protein D9756_000974 [Leucoagaricus leucothites]
MGWFSDDSNQAQAWNQYQNTEPHEAKLSHELIAGAASYEAAKAYEEHIEREGKPQSHEQAKEIFAGFVGAFVDREVESKGLNWIDREKVKRHAQEHGNNYIAQDY